MYMYVILTSNIEVFSIHCASSTLINYYFFSFYSIHLYHTKYYLHNNELMKQIWCTILCRYGCMCTVV